MPRTPELPTDRVANDLRARLEAGEWAPGDKLPGMAELASHYGVSQRTIGKALKRLGDLVEVIPSWGTFRRA